MQWPVLQQAMYLPWSRSHPACMEAGTKLEQYQTEHWVVRFVLMEAAHAFVSLGMSPLRSHMDRSICAWALQECGARALLHYTSARGCSSRNLLRRFSNRNGGDRQGLRDGHAHEDPCGALNAHDPSAGSPVAPWRAGAGPSAWARCRCLRRPRRYRTPGSRAAHMAPVTEM